MLTPSKAQASSVQQIINPNCLESEAEELRMDEKV